jgi:hypothetical protein
MRTIHTEIGIGAPAEAVWELLSSSEDWERWNPFLKVEGKLAGGETLRVTVAGPGGRKLHYEATVKHFDDGREFRWGLRSFGGMFRAEHGFRVTPEDVGRSRFEQFEMFTGLLAPVVLARQGKALRTGFEAMNRALKREAEKRARESA